MLSNQDKKEMLLMIAECVQNAERKTWRGTEESSILGLMVSELHSKAHDLFTDKPEREMPREAENYLFIIPFQSNSNKAFQVTEGKWYGNSGDKSMWSSGRAFLLSERELAEKKCAELNKILAS